MSVVPLVCLSPLGTGARFYPRPPPPQALLQQQQQLMVVVVAVVVAAVVVAAAVVVVVRGVTVSRAEGRGKASE